MSKKSPSSPDALVDLADAPLIALPTLARLERLTKHDIWNVCKRLDIQPEKTLSQREHLSFRQAQLILEHLRQVPAT